MICPRGRSCADPVPPVNNAKRKQNTGFFMLAPSGLQFVDVLLRTLIRRQREAPVLGDDLAWPLAKGPDIVPIPGTKRRQHLEESVAAADLVLEDVLRSTRRSAWRGCRNTVPARKHAPARDGADAPNRHLRGEAP